MTSRYSKLYKPKGAPPSQRSNVITTIKQDMSLQIVWHSILGGRQVKGVIVIRSCKSCPRWTAQSLSSTSPCINSLAMFVSWWGYAITSSKIVLMELLDALASKIFLQGLRCKKNLWPHTLLILIGSCNEHRQTSHTLSHWSNYKFAR